MLSRAVLQHPAGEHWRAFMCSRWCCPAGNRPLPEQCLAVLISSFVLPGWAYDRQNIQADVTSFLLLFHIRGLAKMLRAVAVGRLPTKLVRLPLISGLFSPLPCPVPLLLFSSLALPPSEFLRCSSMVLSNAFLFVKLSLKFVKFSCLTLELRQISSHFYHDGR